jgi:hypothetical protein
LVTAVGVVGNIVFALVAILKGRPVLGVVGVFVPFLALVAVLRLAGPTSPWACSRYDDRRVARARRRFHTRPAHPLGPARRRLRRYARTRGSRPDAAVADTRVPPSVDTGFNLGMACPVDGARAA